MSDPEDLYDSTGLHGLPPSFRQRDWPLLKEFQVSYAHALGASLLCSRSAFTEPRPYLTLLSLCVGLLEYNAMGHLCLPLSQFASYWLQRNSNLEEKKTGPQDHRTSFTYEIPSPGDDVFSSENLKKVLSASGICSFRNSTLIRSDPESNSIHAQESPFGGLVTDNAPDRALSELPLVLIAFSGELFLYTRAFLGFEKRFASILKELSLSPTPQSDDRISAAVDSWMMSLPEIIRPVESQRAAVSVCVNHPLSVLTGGPGTGKTTTVFHILHGLWLAFEGSARIALCAPTGRAARRAGESLRTSLKQCEPYLTGNTDTGFLTYISLIEGKTIHRLIGLSKPFIEPGIQAPPLPFDIVVVDEASMVDLVLMERLLSRLSSGTRLILVGDHRQLPSVEVGAVLADLLATRNPALPIGIARLDRTFRFSGELAECAHLVLEGRGKEAWELMPDYVPSKNQPTVSRISLSEGYQGITVRDRLLKNWSARLGFTDIRDRASQARKNQLSFASDEEQVRALFATLSEGVILCPFKDGPFGSTTINKILCTIVHSGSGRWFPGMPVIVTANDYERGLFNGDRGMIYLDANGNLLAWFPSGQLDVPVSYSPDTIEGLETAYALTIHKSQGSEFNSVLMFIGPRQSPKLQTTRELLYTGITRCRKHLIVAAEPGSFVAACGQSTKRESLLTSFIEGRFEY